MSDTSSRQAMNRCKVREDTIDKHEINVTGA